MARVPDRRKNKSISRNQHTSTLRNAIRILRQKPVMQRIFSRRNVVSTIALIGLLLTTLSVVGGGIAFVGKVAEIPFGFVLIVLVAMGTIAYAFCLRRDITFGPEFYVGQPAEAGIFVERLKREPQCVELAALAKSAFASESMSADQIRALHFPLREDVLLVFDGPRIVGYLAAFVPKMETWERFLDPRFDPRSLSSLDFMRSNNRWSQRRMFVESIVCQNDDGRRRSYFSVLWAGALDALLNRMPKNWATDTMVSVRSFGFSPEGKLILEKSLGLKVLVPETQSGWAPLYGGRVGIERLRSLRNTAKIASQRAINRALLRHQRTVNGTDQ